MEETAVIRFPFKKKKMKGLYLAFILFLFGAAGFILLSHHLFVICGFGRILCGLIGIFLLLISMFCLRAICYLRHEFNAGLIVSDEGVTDISTGYRIGTILWHDVKKIKVMNDLDKLQYQYIVLVVDNPNEYIMREPTMVKKRSLTLKLHQYGSPICISIRALDCTFDDLYQALNGKFLDYKARTSSEAGSKTNPIGE